MSLSLMTYKNKVILITGGTGSFGQAFIKNLLTNHQPKKVIVFSRDEMKQWEMEKKYKLDGRIRFFIGDVRDKDRLRRAFNGVDLIVHAAATKIVPTAERDPFECVKTNVLGAMNVIDAAIDSDVKKVVALSTDKASSPINLYGATKLASDKMFVASNSYGGDNTSFSVVRYGNVLGSRGSVIPLFLSQKENGLLTITNTQMTRFMITLEQGIELVDRCFADMIGGEIYVKKIPSMKIIDIAQAIGPNCEIREVGIRLGEKIHEQMISIEDAEHTYDFTDYYKIIPPTASGDKLTAMTQNGKKMPSGFIYSSDVNDEWMSKEQLLDFIEKKGSTFLTTQL